MRVGLISVWTPERYGRREVLRSDFYGGAVVAPNPPRCPFLPSLRLYFDNRLVGPGVVSESSFVD